MKGGAVGRRIPRYGGGGGRGAVENRDERGKTRGTEGKGRGTMKATEMTATGRRGSLDDPSEHRKNSGARGKYRAAGNETEESTDKSAEWRGEDTEESVLKEEAATAMGAGGAGRPLTATAGDTEERGADGRPWGAAAGMGDTGQATSAAANKAGAGGRHGEKTATRERVASRRENLAGNSYGVGGVGEGREAYGVATEPSQVRGDRGGREAYGVMENPGGDHQGVGGGVESPQGINTPGVDALPQGDETPGVATMGNGVPGESGQGQGGYGTPHTTQATEV